MISSEVQRTLVKSPPELWAEISDPESLGRHLGELGEIRITRSEPEQLVEWESDDATGTVAIKASGWGTRVTLTAARALPEAEPGGDGVVGEPAEALAAEGEVGEGHAEALAAEGEVGEGHEIRAGAAEGAARAAEGGPEEPEGLVVGEAEGGPEEPEIVAEEGEIPIEPVSEAFAEGEAEEEMEAFEPREAEEETHTFAETAAPLEPEPFMRPATPAGAMSAWAQQGTDGASPQPGPQEPDTETEQAPAVESAPLAAAPARRGFFARLFGRRAKPVASTPVALAGARQDAELTIAREAARRRLEATLAVPSPTTGLPQAAEVAGAEAAPTPEAIAERETALAEEPEAIAEPQTMPAEEPEAIAEPQTMPAEEPEAIAEPQTMPAEEPEAIAEAEAEPAAARPSEPMRDLAAELREAEEAAGEKVAAVLRAALDSLGSAHHRPFSRG